MTLHLTPLGLSVLLLCLDMPLYRELGFLVSLASLGIVLYLTYSPGTSQVNSIISCHDISIISSSKNLTSYRSVDSSNDLGCA